jgi:hypothetical protein
VAVAGDISLNMGTAMVFYTLIDTMQLTLKENQIFGLCPINNKYFLLSLEKEFGNIIESLKERYFSSESYNDLFSCYSKLKNEPEKFVSISIKDSKIIADESIPKELLTASVINYFINKILDHLVQINEHCPIKKIYISGGVSQGKWLEILKQEIKYHLFISNGRQAALIGAIKIFLKNNQGER